VLNLKDMSEAEMHEVKETFARIIATPAERL
jgi:hypothetical protein